MQFDVSCGFLTLESYRECMKSFCVSAVTFLLNIQLTTDKNLKLIEPNHEFEFDKRSCQSLRQWGLILSFGRNWFLSHCHCIWDRDGESVRLGRPKRVSVYIQGSC